MINVAHFISRWLPLTQNWVHTQLSHLPPQHVRSSVVCYETVQDSAYAWDPVIAMRQMNDPGYVLSSIVRKTVSPRYYPHLRRALKQLDAHVLHSHFGDSAWVNAPAARAAGVAHVATFYGYDGNRLPHEKPVWASRFRELFNDVDAVLCEGPAFAAKLQHLGCAQDRVIVHPLGLTLSALPFEPASWDGRQPIRFLLAGRFAEKKGFRYALDAIGQVARQAPVAVTIVGAADPTDGSRAEAAAMEAAIEAWKLGGAVRKLGMISLDRLREEIASHHFFMASSVTASDGDTEGGAPVTANEAQAMGIPVIGTDHCDIPFILNQGVALSPEKDVGGLVKQIEWWLTAPGAWPDRLRSGRAHVEQVFDATKQGEQLARIYDKVLQNRQ